MEAGQDDPGGLLRQILDLLDVGAFEFSAAREHKLHPAQAALGEGPDQVELTLLRDQARSQKHIAPGLQRECRQDAGIAGTAYDRDAIGHEVDGDTVSARHRPGDFLRNGDALVRQAHADDFAKSQSRTA